MEQVFYDDFRLFTTTMVRNVIFNEPDTIAGIKIVTKLSNTIIVSH